MNTPKIKKYIIPLIVIWVFTIKVSIGLEKPNVLFIAIDDQNDWIGCLGGHPQVKTPNIDKLAENGTVFLNAHCQSPLCNPSRTSLMTGLRPTTTGIYGLAPWFRKVASMKDLVTLPQHFQNHGYLTMSAGKIYHGRYGRENGKNQEFDVIGPAASAAPFPKQRLVGKTPQNHKLVDWGTFPHRDDEKGDFKIANWGIEKLNSQPKEPFFLALGFFLPHVPCFATQKWFDLYPENEIKPPQTIRNDRSDTPRFSWYLHWKLPEVRLKFLEEKNEWVNLTRSYMACTSFVDHQIGRVIDALEKNDQAKNTIVVLWSDHGWHIGEKEITGKNTLWDDGTRVPLIFSGPGINKGRCKQPVELLDIFPTLNEMCNLPSLNHLEGLSLKPQLTNFKTKRVKPAITCHNHDNNAVRSENWRYILYADGSEEFYDMKNDPNEWENLASNKKYKELMMEHRKWIPEKNQKPAPGSKYRILTYDKENGEVIWEGKKIKNTDSVPEI